MKAYFFLIISFLTATIIFGQENFILWLPLITPAHIVPEYYRKASIEST